MVQPGQDGRVFWLLPEINRCDCSASAHLALLPR